jgi:hypothetical protein
MGLRTRVHAEEEFMSGKIKCETCDGTGKMGSQCCGDDINQQGRCESCKQIAIPEYCDDCDGTGIDFGGG